MHFSETFQLLLPWPEEDHINRGHAWLIFTSYGPLSVLVIYQQKFLFDVFQVPISIRLDTLWVQLTYSFPPTLLIYA